MNADARLVLANSLTVGRQRRGPVVRHRVRRDPLAVRHHRLVGDVVRVAIGLRRAIASHVRRRRRNDDRRGRHRRRRPNPTGRVRRAESTSVDKRVYMVADSVGLGARGALPGAFPADWQVVLDGTPALFVEQLESKYVRAVPQSLLGDYGVIAGGYNYPYWDPARFDRSIDSIIGAFEERGVKHVFWVTLREVKPQFISAGAWNQVQPYYWYFPTVNEHLERALERHPNLTLVDWAAVADRPGITYDAIHLNTTGAQLYSSLIRQGVDAATQRVAAGSVTRIAVPDAAGTAAVALNLTTTAPRTTGFLTAFACDSATPVVSNHNHVRGQVVASAAIVPVSSSGEVCVYSFTDTNLIVDITGRFLTGTGVVTAAPQRLADTRSTGPAARHPAGVPLHVAIPVDAGAATTAVALDVTAVGATAPGYATVYPCDESVPATSNVNYGVGAATPNLAIVRPSTNSEVCVVASTDVNLLVDLFAVFDETAEARARPTRRASSTQGAPAAHRSPRGPPPRSMSPPPGSRRASAVCSPTSPPHKRRPTAS